MRNDRALTKDGKWEFGGYCKVGGRHYIIPYDATIETFQVTTLGFNCRQCALVGYVEVIPETVGQSTGLKANGVEIYEGDIVKHYRTNKIQKVHYSTCYLFPFARGMEHYKSSLSSSNNDEYEVIGDIHTTPEKMEVSE